jgi:hypothetical protein
LQYRVASRIFGIKPFQKESAWISGSARKRAISAK